jgi:hypothetical protein
LLQYETHATQYSVLLRYSMRQPSKASSACFFPYHQVGALRGEFPSISTDAKDRGMADPVHRSARIVEMRDDLFKVQVLIHAFGANLLIAHSSRWNFAHTYDMRSLFACLLQWQISPACYLLSCYRMARLLVLQGVRASMYEAIWLVGNILAYE